MYICRRAVLEILKSSGHLEAMVNRKLGNNLVP